MEARAHILVSGYVQGVGYRYFVYRAANNLGLTGYVRNLFNGDVEVVVEGERGLIIDFLETLRIGCRSAHVSDVKVKWENWKGEFNNFRIGF